MHYLEKIAYLPHSFMPHDIKGREISDKPFVRSDFDLPENGFVFCCFNNAYKINPDVFQVLDDNHESDRWQCFVAVGAP